MRRIFALLLLAVTLAGCSVAAQAAGAQPSTVQTMGDLDAAVLGPLVGAIAAGIASATAEQAEPAPAYNAFLCYLNPDGGEEVRADTAFAAEQICLSRHGRGYYDQHCLCERVD